MMRFAVLCVAAASLLRGREELEAQTARSAVMLLQEALATEPAKAPAKTEAKATPAKTEAKATPAKAEPKAPKKWDPAQQKMVVDQLMKLAEHLQDNEKKIVEMDKQEVASQKDHEKLKANMSDADKKMWDHFDDWNHRMNQKTKVGSLDVISKIKHAVHFIKKGAMSGDEDAAKGLEDVIASMGSMMR